MNNYRPVSNQSFMSKLIERVVASQLNEYLSANYLLPRFQSAYRKDHFTETALLRWALLARLPPSACPTRHALLQVWSDMLKVEDERRVTRLSLLDMSAAFDCVDHLILLQSLQVAVAIGDTALDCIRSFLSGRTEHVVYSGKQSVTSVVLFGHVTVLRPLLHILYMAPLFDIIVQHRVNAHQYADDLQCICACCRRKLRSLLTVSMCVSSTSKPGRKQAGSDFT